jgi:4-amino-4-deoxy-L-arabinose transferase-like glycosyltransferase/CheY-like chemotaxis protein
MSFQTENKSKPALLIADDDKQTLERLRSALQSRYEVWVAGDAKTAMTLLEVHEIQAVLLGSGLPPIGDLKVFQRAKLLIPPPVCILMAATNPEALAHEATQEGADDYFALEGVPIDDLPARIDSALAKRKLSPPASPTPAPKPALPDEDTQRFEPRKTIGDRIQRAMWGLEAGAGARVLKVALALIGFLLLALWFCWQNTHGFSNREAIESAHLARHLAGWQGYTTYSIRPSVLGLLERADPPHAAEVLRHPVPDLSIAPGYPFALAVLMKVLPFNFSPERTRFGFYQPELLITGFNILLFLAAILLLFQMARRFFDNRVAWVTAIIFAGSRVCWRFSFSGLSTMWLLLIFLVMVWCLLALEERENRPEPPRPGATQALAAAIGALAGLGGLSRYSFAWMIGPALLFVGLFCPRRRGRLLVLTAFSFLLVLGPWVARNLVLSNTPFGTAGFALQQNTRPSEEDRVERSFDPYTAGLKLISVRDLARKFTANEEKIVENELPRLGGNWTWSFFLCGLLLPCRQRALRHLRCFTLVSLALLAVAQALGQTYLSVESPEINSENLLVLLFPLVLVFGTGFFFILLDQLALEERLLRFGAAGCFAAIMCAPLLLGIASRAEAPTPAPYSPLLVQRTAAMMKPDELMMSDIPWAVAWYGERPCVWLTVDDAGTFAAMCRLKPVQALYLTERTTDRSFLSQVLGNKRGWGRFLLDSLPAFAPLRGGVPDGFPLTAAAAAYLPGQLFVTDTVRWKEAAKK